MAEHRFSIGEHVRVLHRYPDPASSAVYEVVRLMPETNGEAYYRVKSMGGQERAASESQLSPVEPAVAMGT